MRLFQTWFLLFSPDLPRHISQWTDIYKCANIYKYVDIYIDTIFLRGKGPILWNTAAIVSSCSFKTDFKVYFPGSFWQMVVWPAVCWADFWWIAKAMVQEYQFSGNPDSTAMWQYWCTLLLPLKTLFSNAAFHDSGSRSWRAPSFLCKTLSYKLTSKSGMIFPSLSIW